jgi:predicted aldo/keto reductase-like oxidoreductase
MQYRTFPKISDLPISILGFGCMRLPVVDGDPARIDEARAARLLHEAIEGGVNYVDTAYPYHGGQSEPFVGRALKDGYRGRVQLATRSGASRRTPLTSTCSTPSPANAGKP